MTKFKIVKRFSLDFVGEEWKDAYIDFQSLTVLDVRNKFPSLSRLDEKDQDNIVKGIDSVVEILKDKFLEGKGIDIEGKLVELTPDDLEALPMEVLSRALGFLSQVTTPNSPLP